MTSDALNWCGAWRIARRDLSGGLKGLRLLAACLFLGTMALAAIGTLTAAIEAEIAGRGQELLGGDVEVEVWQRDLTAQEKAALARYGRVSGGTRMQAMASAPVRADADENGEALAAPIGLKAVDRAYPLYGALTLTDGRRVGAPSMGEAWLDQGALDRLGLKVGERFVIGGQSLIAAGVIAHEPDRLSEGFQLGPTVIVARDFPDRAGLTAPGALYQSKYRIGFDKPRDPQAVAEALKKEFPDAGFDIRTRDRASPGADRFVTRMGEFLTLVALAALVIAGIGIGLGVSSYLDARRKPIATLKVLGASARDIARIYGLQIAFVAAVAALAGLAAGVALTPLIGRALSGLLPVRGGLVIDPRALALAAAFGALVAMIFAAPALARARQFPAMALMRARSGGPLGLRRALPIMLGGAGGIVALVLATSSNPWLAAGFLLAAALALGLLALVGWAIRALAARAPQAANPLLRLAIANLHRPQNQTGAMVSALGFGLGAFVLLAAIQTSLDNNIARTIPRTAPDYFVLDIPRDRVGEFERLVERLDPHASVRAVPTLRGAILAYGPRDRMTRVSELEEIPDGAWPLRGERGLTYADRLPQGNRLVEGQWWRPDYTGEPLVSVDAEFARAIDLEIGDYLTIGVLGVERRARVANLRQLDWENMGFNFVLVFSPNALADTPHNFTATIELDDKRAAAALLRQMVRAFPSSSVIEVGDVLAQARAILEQVALASFAAASVAVLAGLAVLIGAIAAARAARRYDIVVLRVLGASRGQLLAMQLAEFAVLGAVLGALALGLGGALGWAVITQLFDFDWLPDWGVVAMVLLGALALVVGIALALTLPLLKEKPAQALREL